MVWYLGDITSTTHDTVTDKLILLQSTRAQLVWVFDIVSHRLSHILIWILTMGILRHKFHILGGRPFVGIIPRLIWVLIPSTHLDPIVLDFIREGKSPEEMSLLMQDEAKSGKALVVATKRTLHKLYITIVLTP